MTTDTLVMAANTPAWPRLTSSTSIANTLTVDPVINGVPVRLLTFANHLPSGSRLSRAIENITRDADAWIAKVAEKIATATVISSVLPTRCRVGW